MQAMCDPGHRFRALCCPLLPSLHRACPSAVLGAATQHPDSRRRPPLRPKRDRVCGACRVCVADWPAAAKISTPLAPRLQPQPQHPAHTAFPTPARLPCPCANDAANCLTKSTLSCVMSVASPPAAAPQLSQLQKSGLPPLQPLRRSIYRC
jgi:hypothetical protein